MLLANCFSCAPRILARQVVPEGTIPSTGAVFDVMPVVRLAFMPVDIVGDKTITAHKLSYNRRDQPTIREGTRGDIKKRGGTRIPHGALDFKSLEIHLAI